MSGALAEVLALRFQQFRPYRGHSLSVTARACSLRRACRCGLARDEIVRMYEPPRPFVGCDRL